MSDITAIWDTANARGDWSQLGAIIKTGGDLATSILVSLFTDKRLPDGQALPIFQKDRRGHWSDTYTGQQIGSLLWTLRLTPIGNRDQFLATAESMAQDALDWLATDGVVQVVSVTAVWLSAIAIGFAIQVTEPDGSTTQTFNFQWVWQQLAETN